MTEDYLFGVSEFTTWPWSFAQDVETYARLGVQAIEVCEFKLDPPCIGEQMALPAAHGLAITSVQPSVRTFFPSRSQPDPLDPQERMHRFRQTITRLAPYTPGVAYVLSTGAPPNGNVQAVLDTAVREGRAMAEFAADHGVRVALEPLSATSMNVETAVWTVAQGMELVRAIDHESFGICLDCWNVWQNADLDQSIRECGDKIFVVQISDWRSPRSFQDRLIPGQGEIPLAGFLRSVRETGYSGAYSVEIFSGDVPDSLWAGNLEAVIQDSRAGMDAAWSASF